MACGKCDDMRTLFYQMEEDISGWDVSNVQDMSWMFYKASSFTGNLSSWDVSSVQDMHRMCNGATSFNSDIGSWIISNETVLTSTFLGASSFNQDLCEWRDKFPYASSDAV